MSNRGSATGKSRAQCPGGRFPCGQNRPVEALGSSLRAIHTGRERRARFGIEHIKINGTIQTGRATRAMAGLNGPVNFNVFIPKRARCDRLWCHLGLCKRQRIDGENKQFEYSFS